ncbi:TetR/AcrR family transcriptional regulator C-terminal ligand-binding domain-containing protein [Mycobacterium montefiorense]|uniref:TetR/AcrR family transcriptional regulator C-terminal ligand-binding domain-containing protein n=1 Tax=Mycobacterium montefiorense TaxID=154654 RepID=UPI0021F3B01F|nr:TetR/AcrR family transcriptional regulator C-terminal ligand-binding domain-containing protein [Mycobacterium montefiorense]
MTQRDPIRGPPDLRAWLNEHGEFLAEPPNAALVRALVAAAAARPGDGEDLYQQLSAPQLAGMTTRLRQAIDNGGAAGRCGCRCRR